MQRSEEGRAQPGVKMGAKGPPAQLPWRAELVGGLLRTNILVQAALLLAIWVFAQSHFARLAIVIPGLGFLVVLAFELGCHRLGTCGRAWLLVINYLVLGLIGYAVAGFYSGATLAVCAAFLLARVLLGRRTLLVLFGVFTMSICIIGWAMVTARLPWEPVRTDLLGTDLSTQAPEAWVRTTLVALLHLSLMSLLVARTIGWTEATMLDNVRLRDEALRAVRQRDEFLSMASHELLTPLGALKMASEGLTSGRIPATPINLQRTLGLVRRNVDRLTALVGQLLEVSQSQSDRIDLFLEEVDLSALVREVVERFAEQSQNAVSISLTLDPLARGRWDRSRLERVTTNLLENALKFGAGKPIEVSVGIRDSMALLVVRDHGVGIPTETTVHIFDRFFRGSSPRAGGGLGLGLFIVRTIVEALGGTIRVERPPNEGTSFTVELPSSGPPSVQGAQQGPTS